MLNFKNLLVNLHYLNHPLLSGLSALAILLIGVFILLKNTRSELYRSFFWLTLTISIWFFGNAFSMFYFNNFELALFWYRFGYSGVPFISVAFYHFYLTYFKKKKNILYILYSIAILEILYLWISDDIKKIDHYIILQNVGLVWKEILSPFFYFLVFGMVKYIILSFFTAVSFLNEYKRETDAFEKARLKWLTILFFTTVFAAIEWLVAFDIPLHIAWMVIPFFIGSVAYAILKYQLMDIRIIIRKAFFYALGIALITGVMMGMTFLNTWFVKNIPDFQVWTVPLLVGIVAFIIGNLFYQKSKQIEKAYQIEKESRIALGEMKNVLEVRVRARTRELRELAEMQEEIIKERTKELQERVEELERFGKLAVGRELKMIELKKEIKKLKEELEKFQGKKFENES